ncbi:MAG: hypothetical protein R3277_09890 [Brumimicrobium sp.]|nr:hypothetical protein [Brumimicrobium sp.]
MKKLKLLGVLVTLVALSLSSCKKIDQSNPEFVGFWKGSDNNKVYVIEIKSNSEGRYSESEGALNSTENTGAAKFKNGYLKIGAFKKFKVDETPFTLNGSTFMKVEGITYLKY